ncbi:hypothetical protein ACWFR4_47805, partial [Streptomyces sp. NPDC055140]
MSPLEPTKELVHVPLRLPSHLQSADVGALLEAMEVKWPVRRSQTDAEVEVPKRDAVQKWKDKVASVALVNSGSASIRADRGRLDLVLFVKGKLVALVECKASSRRHDGLFAALNARRAILESRADSDWVPTVAEFAETWLGIKRATTTWVEAVSTALLGDWVDEIDRTSWGGHDHLAVDHVNR